MSAKGHSGVTKYDEGKEAVEKWFGRAYWISDELKSPF